MHDTIYEKSRSDHLEENPVIANAKAILWGEIREFCDVTRQIVRQCRGRAAIDVCESAACFWKEMRGNDAGLAAGGCWVNHG